MGSLAGPRWRGHDWRRWTCGVALIVGCATVRLERQHLADGSWQLTCPSEMDACTREANSICKDKRYLILAGRSETRRRDAPPYETEYHTSYLTIVCSEETAPPPAPSAAPPTRDLARSICTPGATQACVGSGACSGGQACRPDGTGFGPCDCGSAKAAPDARPSPSPSDGGLPLGRDGGT
jgi:hypothetical protein